MNISIFDGKEDSINDLIAWIQTSPFLAEKRLVFILDIPASSAKGVNKEKQESVLSALEDINEDVVLILIQPSPDKRTKLFKFLIKNVQVEEFKDLTTFELSQWIQKNIDNRGWKILPSAISFLIDRVGINMWTLNNEINKLITYTNNEKPISENDIKNITNINFSTNIFKFIDAVSAKNKRQALLELSNFTETGDSLIMVFMMLIKHIRALLYASENPSKQDLVKDLSLHPFVAWKVLFQVKIFKKEKLIKIYQKFLDIDIRLKTGEIKISTYNEKLLALELEKVVLSF